VNIFCTVKMQTFIACFLFFVCQFFIEMNVSMLLTYIGFYVILQCVDQSCNSFYDT